MAIPKTFAAIMEWLREGYPDGVPRTDYFPLLALLNREVSQAEIQQVVDSLMAATDEVTRTDIAVALTKLTNDLPGPSDIERVARRLDLRPEDCPDLSCSDDGCPGTHD